MFVLTPDWIFPLRFDRLFVVGFRCQVAIEVEIVLCDVVCVCAGSWNRSIRAINTGAGSASFLLLAFHCAIRMFSIVQCRVFLGTLQYTYSSKRTAAPSWNDQSSFSLFKKSRRNKLNLRLGALNFASLQSSIARGISFHGPTLFINGPGAFFLLLSLSLCPEICFASRLRGRQ